MHHITLTPWEPIIANTKHHLVSAHDNSSHLHYDTGMLLSMLDAKKIWHLKNRYYWLDGA